MAQVIRVFKSVSSIAHNTGATAVASSSYSVIHSGIGGPVKEMEIYNGTSQVLIMGIGNSGAEVQQPFTIFPNGNPSIPFVMAHNSRICLQAVSTSCTAGYVVINFYA